MHAAIHSHHVRVLLLSTRSISRQKTRAGCSSSPPATWPVAAAAPVDTVVLVRQLSPRLTLARPRAWLAAAHSISCPGLLIIDTCISGCSHVAVPASGRVVRPRTPMSPRRPAAELVHTRRCGRSPPSPIHSFITPRVPLMDHHNARRRLGVARFTGALSNPNKVHGRPPNPHRIQWADTGQTRGRFRFQLSEHHRCCSRQEAPLIASEISLSPGGTRAEFSDASCHTPAQQLPCPQHSESTVKPRPNPTRLVERTKPLEATEPPHGPHPRPVHAPVALARRANPASQRPTNPASPSGRAHQNPPRRHGHEHANTKI